ncbi:venom acid phosphatase Acph-1-like [Anoplophora glabripennis]|uniref:venom acid phosphatase Acph-1-like n=1 Tax=Anoplophora glabripennis TaxID=217634 RepID=UPI000874BC20|nr:venom acid phosphatase Acph-1-like [Anoplophora glabripennis]
MKFCCLLVNPISTMVGLFCAVLLRLFAFCSNSGTNEETLVLVHVLFRHGERTVDPSTLYPTDPYKDEKYYPYGVGQLTNAGKITEYKIGKALRKRYDNFLGRVYEPDLLDAQSTDVNRTKMSLELVLAGLFPPIGDQIFETGLYWQPIPYNFIPKGQDNILLGILCPNYEKYYNRLMKSKKWQREFFERRELFNYLSFHSGWNISNYGDIFYLYFGLRSEKEWGFELPEWTKLVYPQPLEDMVIKEYFVATSTTNLRRLATGYHLRKILDDTKAKIEGTLKPPSRKIFLYSAHESNVANFLTTLDIFEPQIPPYGCYILVEVHQINGIYGIKIFYQDYIGDGPKLLKLAACEEFCPLNKFESLVEEYLPADDFCGRE